MCCLTVYVLEGQCMGLYVAISVYGGTVCNLTVCVLGVSVSVCMWLSLCVEALCAVSLYVCWGQYAGLYVAVSVW